MEPIVESSFPSLELHRSNMLLVGIAIAVYAVYLLVFKYHKVIMKGYYNTKLKKIGRTIPPFPNGWFIVCKSAELKKG